MSNDETYEYDIAISFAGKDRSYAEALADVLRNRGVHVFYENMKKLFFGEKTFIHIYLIFIRTKHATV